MGYIVESATELAGLEIRGQSVVLKEKGTSFPDAGNKNIFVYHHEVNGEIFCSVELTKQYLEELLAFFDNPKNRELFELSVGDSLATGE